MLTVERSTSSSEWKMDEVKAMASQTVGKIARKQLRELKRNAEQKLTEHGLDPQQLTQALGENAAVARDEVVKTTRRAGKKIAKNARRTRKELTRNAKETAKQARRGGRKVLSKLDKKAAKVARKAEKKASRRRRWPWIVGLGLAAAAGAYAVRSRTAAPAALEDDLSIDNEQPPTGAPEHNGSVQHARGVSSKN